MRRTLSICALALVALAAPAIAGGDGNGAAAIGPLTVKSATLTIDGTSTMHDYTLSTTVLTLSSALGDTASLLQPGALQALELQVPVNSFTTEKDGLKKKMLETIKAEKFPVITFRLASYAIDSPAAGHGAVLAKGALTVAGVEQPIELALDLHETPDGLKVRGTHALSMKAFGIKPPTMFMGMLKTHDKVTVTFELQLSPAATASN